MGRLFILTILAILALLAALRPDALVDARDAREDGFAIAGERYSTRAVRQLALPAGLREASGLALDPSGQVLAHDDERGIVYRIGPNSGRVLGRIVLQGNVRADFEGIALARERLFLVTSRGALYETRAHAARGAPVTRHRETLPCEVEGLTAAKDQHSLLVACKRPPGKGERIVIYRWTLASRSYSPEPVVRISRKTLRAFLASRGLSEVGKVRPTGLALAGNGNLVVLAGRAHLLLELTPSGTLLAAARLDPAFHPQAEGIAFAAGGRLLIADEGGKHAPGRLSVYRPVR